MKYSFVFVCQQGELEIKALLLAASLRHFLRCEYELVAAVPQPEAYWGRPITDTLDTLVALGVRVVSITNPIGTEYPVGNKLACLNIETTADRIVFLDSDMLCMREFYHSPRFERDINVKPADLRTFGSASGEWRRVYTALGLDFPATLVVATVSGETMPPYFNAGMIAVRRDAGLGDAWVACARVIDADASIGNKRPWLDQIALPAAVAKLGLDVDCFDERYNYPAHLKPIDEKNLPYFCHYHYPSVLRSEPLANALVLELAGQYPALQQVIESAPDWRVLLQPYACKPSELSAAQSSVSTAMYKAERGANVVITGIPRSGTSYLCSILNKVRDCVAINEPTQIFAPLAGPGLPWGVATFYRDLRRDILDGRPIQNKLHNGEFIEDTSLVDAIADYSPEIDRSNFLLATKNTLAYLARLPELRRVMPKARIVVCVRNPLDTIASWKTTFDHLAKADVNSFPVGNPQDTHLSAPALNRLAEIARTSALPLRRALLWRHLAELILENRDRVLLLRYEDLVSRPTDVLQEILDASCSGLVVELMAPLAPSAVRTKRDALDADDVRAIRSICGQTAAELGYGEL